MNGIQEASAGAMAESPAMRFKIRFVDAYFYSLLAYFAISNLYYSYRYILKYNAEETSPTYSATPVTFQVPKYILAAMIFALGIFLIGLLKPNRIHRAGGLAFLGAGYFALSALLNNDLASPAFLKMFFLNVPVVLPLAFLTLGPAHIAVFRKCIGFLFVYHMAYSAIQLTLFFTVGRLPALGYADSIMVRFGGGLDDPNGFAPLALCLCIYIFDRIAYDRFTPGRLLLLLYASGLYLFTVSFTSFASAPLMLAGYALLRKRARPALAAGALATIAIVAALAVFTPMIEYAELLIETKQGSIEEHFRWGIKDFADYPLLNWALGSFGQFETRFTESDLVFLFFRYGIAGLGILFGITLLAVRGYLSVLAANPAVPQASFVVCAIIYLVSFVVGTWNLPYFQVHPINLDFWVLALLGLSQRPAILEWVKGGMK